MAGRTVGWRGARGRRTLDRCAPSPFCWWGSHALVMPHPRGSLRSAAAAALAAVEGDLLTRSGSVSTASSADRPTVRRSPGWPTWRSTPTTTVTPTDASHRCVTPRRRRRQWRPTRRWAWPNRHWGAGRSPAPTPSAPRPSQRRVLPHAAAGSGAQLMRALITTRLRGPGEAWPAVARADSLIPPVRRRCALALPASGTAHQQS